ncbi:MAG: YjgP/YjgQ family permease [Armatimonadetes bacterium]|nr:YjgP/YjgQ family permease [Armatimonadota bacterium]
METPATTGSVSTPPTRPAPESRPPRGAPPGGAGQTAPRAAIRSYTLLDVLLWVPRLLHRIAVPRLLDRYVQGELLRPLLFSWVLFLVLFVLTVDLFKLTQLLGRGARPAAVAELLWLKTILATVYCLPMAILLAGLLAFGRLSGDSELIAMQAAGVTPLRVISNAALFGVILSLAGLALNEHVIPPAGKRFHFLEDMVKAEIKGQILEEASERKAFVINDFEGGKLARLVVARKYEPERPPYPATLRDVTFVEYDRGVWRTIISAPRAEWIGGQQWRFLEPELQNRMSGPDSYRIRNRPKELRVRLLKTPDQVRREQKDADQMTYGELGEYIAQLREQRVRSRTIRELEVERERKLSVPFAALVLALIGAALGIRRQRATPGVGVGLSLLIIILYYAGMSFLGTLGESGQIGALEAAWGSNVAGLLTGLFLTARSAA